MPSYRVTPDEMPGLFREREATRYQRLVKAVRDEVLTSGPAIATQLTRQRTARLRAPINTGQYIRAWQAKPLGDGAVLFNDNPVASIIERGRRPGSRMPPIDKIAEWLEQKMRGQVKNRRDRAKQARGLAFVVARAIAKRGLPAHRIMARTKRLLDPLVRKAVEWAMSGQTER